MLPRLSEDELIAAYFAPLAGPGGLHLDDDAALLQLPPGEELVLTKDMLVAGVHFFADDPPDAIARKALRVNLSDLAAKGAKPEGFLLGLALPADWREDWLQAFAKGLAEDAKHFAIHLLGGDTVGTPGPLTLSITALGSVPAGKMIRRISARVGDHIFVSGTIGDAALGLRLRHNAETDRSWINGLNETDRSHLLSRYLLPQPRLGLRAALLAHAHAAMDISDGFAGDLSKMLRLAGLTAVIDGRLVPFSEAGNTVLRLAPQLLNTLLSGGDDYELVGAVPEEKVDAFTAQAAASGVAVSDIGICRSGDQAIELKGFKGEALPLTGGSFKHF